MKSMRESFGNALLKIGRSEEDVVVVDADLSKSTKTEYFKRTFPSRFVDVGIAEQNLVGVSAGLASTGKNVFASSFAVFETGRAYEVIRNTVCLANLNVKLCATHAGIMTGPDGATHQSIEDIAIMRVLPNISVLVPADSKEAELMTLYLAKHKGPAYLRLVRDDVEELYTDEDVYSFGKASVLKKGDDISIIACGPMVSVSLKAAMKMREEGIEARVINMSTIKPIDVDVIIDCAKETRGIVTVEDHSIIGGLGSAVSEVISENYPVLVKKIGIEDSFGMSGKSDQLYEHYGLTVEKIIKKANEILAE